MKGSRQSREKRWIVLSDDGRHVTLGRHSDPSDDEINRAGEALRATGIGGWLALLEGIYYGRGEVALMMVREVAPPRAQWDFAVASFIKLRKQANSPPSP